jgi:hypothetical protein
MLAIDATGIKYKNDLVGYNSIDVSCVHDLLLSIKNVRINTV